MSKATTRNSSLEEKPLCRSPRRLADWLNPDGQKKVHSLVDKVYQPKNLRAAWEKVKANRGSGGVDGQSLTAFEQGLNVRRGHIGDAGLNHDLRIEGGNPSRGSDGLGQGLGSIAFVEKRLPLQVAGFNIVAIDNPNASHAGAGKHRGKRGAGRSATYNSESRGRELALPLRSNAAKKHLARISFIRFQRGHRFPACKLLL